MNKKLIVASAVAGLSIAAAGTAMALENEIHGSFTAAGFVSNGYNSGTGAIPLDSTSRTSNFVDQRARLLYTAKANDNLKLVTHFELDTKWGGRTGGKYTNQGDAGGPDGDGINLETKNVYLDFNIPGAPINAKVGLLPWADSYKSAFGFVDDTGVVLSGKFDAVTLGFGWLRIADATGALDGVSTNTTGAPNFAGKQTVDLIAVDGKFALNKDMTVGASYYTILRDAPSTTGLPTSGVGTAAGFAEWVNMVGLNFAGKFGPAAIDAWAAYQFGDYNDDNNQDLSAYGAGVTGKLAAGPGTASLAVLYLSGEKDFTGKTISNWQFISANQTYYNDANMWFLVRNPLSINTSEAIGSNDLTKGGRGLLGVFAGYNGAVDKVLFGANAGWAQVNETRDNTAEDKKQLGTEVNGMIGYKLYDNLTAKVNLAYCFLGDGAKKPVADGGIGISGKAAGTGKADDLYLANLVLQYTF